jgi:hypothetical protein
MLFDTEVQKDLLNRLDNEASSLADYLYPDGDKHVNCSLDRIEMLIKALKDSFLDKNTYIKLVDRETGDIVMKYFEKGDVGALCYKASQYYAWADCDDTYRIDEIMCDGVELYYRGWQPGMLFEFVSENGGIVYSAEFPQWDH